jgi:sugar/nucleoside kinase (ribokinase family)
VIGAASRDLDADDPRGWQLGGGVSYGALVAARLGVRVGALVGLDGPARAEAHEVDLLRDAGVEVVIAPLESGPVFRNVVTAVGRHLTCDAPSDPIEPAALPDAWHGVSTVLLAPVAAELPDAWADAFPLSTSVALGWQGLLRDLVPGAAVGHLPAQPRPLFARADVAGMSMEDLRGGSEDLGVIVPRAGQELVVTAGDGGALHLLRMASGFRAQAFPVVPTDDVRDTTGAGDAFLTAWTIARLGLVDPEVTDSDLPSVMRFAAAVASLTVEAVGLAGLPSLRAVRQRLEGGHGSR